MSSEGFLALLLLLLATGVALALSYQPRYQRVIHYPKGGLYVRYHLAGWTALALAAGLCWWLWDFRANPVPQGVLFLHPEPRTGEYLLPLLFLFLGAAIVILIALQLALCGAVVMPRRGHRKVPAPAEDGTRRDSPVVAVAIGVVVWIPALLGYELMRNAGLYVDGEQLRFRSVFRLSDDSRTWQDVARLEYRPWYSRRKGTQLHHGMALVMRDGSEWHLRDDGFWGLDDKPTRDRLRELARQHGVAYVHGEAK